MDEQKPGRAELPGSGDQIADESPIDEPPPPAVRPGLIVWGVLLAFAYAAIADTLLYGLRLSGERALLSFAIAFGGGGVVFLLGRLILGMVPALGRLMDWLTLPTLYGVLAAGLLIGGTADAGMGSDLPMPEEQMLIAYCVAALVVAALVLVMQRSIVFAVLNALGVLGAVVVLGLALTATAEDAPRRMAGHTDGVTAVDLSGNGQLLASGGWDESVRIWDASTGEPLKTLNDHGADIDLVVFSPDDTLLLAGGGSSRATVWDTQSWRVVRSVGTANDPVYAAGFSVTGSLLATGGPKTVRIHDVRTWRVLRTVNCDTVACVAFAPDGTLAVGYNNRGPVLLYPPGMKGAAIRFDLRTPGGPDGLAFSPDGRLLAIAMFKVVEVWDATTGKPVAQLTGHTHVVADVEFSPDGQLLASAGSGLYDRSVRVWRTDDWTLAHRLRHHSPVYSVSFPSRGGSIATGSGRLDKPGDVLQWARWDRYGPQGLPAVAR